MTPLVSWLLRAEIRMSLKHLTYIFVQAFAQRSLLEWHLLITSSLCFWLHFHNLNFSYIYTHILLYKRCKHLGYSGGEADARAVWAFKLDQVSQKSKNIYSLLPKLW